MKKAVLTGLIGMALAGAARADALFAQPLPELLRAAGAEYPGLASLCDLSQPWMSAGHGRKREPAPVSTRAVPAKKPTRIFDNLYFVGHSGVSSWALSTDQGIILIDAMNNNDEARDYVEQGLRSLGLDPGDIKYLIITHGHGDHYGGQEYLVNKYSPRVVMSDADWTLLERDQRPWRNPLWGKPPVRDISVADGDTLALGEARVHVYTTPGHTAGSLSLIFSVRDGDRLHQVGLWGGAGLNVGPQPQRLRQYSASAQRFRQIAQDAGVDVFLSNHANRDGTRQRMARLATRQPAVAHPFVSANALAAFDLLAHCSLSQAQALEEKLSSGR